MKKQVLVAVKLKKQSKIFSFPSRKAALEFARELKKIDKNIEYSITK